MQSSRGTAAGEGRTPSLLDESSLTEERGRGCGEGLEVSNMVHSKKTRPKIKPPFSKEMNTRAQDIMRGRKPMPQAEGWWGWF